MRSTILPAAATRAARHPARHPARHASRRVASRWVATAALALPALALPAAGALGALLGTPRAADGRTFLVQPARWEFRIPVGGLVPTGGQRASLKDAHLTAAQLSYVIRPPFAVTATVAWTRSRDLASGGDPRLDVAGHGTVGGSYALSRQTPCGLPAVGLGRGTGMPASVAASRTTSCRFAPATTTPTGTPADVGAPPPR